MKTRIWMKTALGCKQLEATPNPVLFPYNGGTGFFTVTTSTTASYTVTKSGNINITAESPTAIAGGGQTIKVEYAIPPATLPGKALVQ